MSAGPQFADGIGEGLLAFFILSALLIAGLFTAVGWFLRWCFA